MQLARRLYDRLFPPAPLPIRDALVRFQYQAVRRHIPSLHLTALVNVCLVMGVLWHVGSPVAHYAWMPFVGAFNVYRILLWRAQSEATPPHALRFLRNSTLAALGSISAISAYSATTYALGWFPYPVLIPVSLAFGAFSIAHSLASMRPAASAVIAIGIFPSAIAMLASGDFLSICLGFSAASVGMLQLRFLAEHQQHVLATLKLQQEVEQLASRDSLTGLLNRRAFLAAFDRIAADGRRRALLVLDLDHFKAINDRHGHDAGDRVLFQFAALIGAACRDGDIAGRFGGEEFVLLAAADDVLAFAERLGRTIAAHDFRTPGCPVENVTVSIGIEAVSPGSDFDAAFARADAALYAAKASGRNCVRLAVPQRAAA
ncbi:MAG: diguanylate cyclase [Sphingomonadaceae bacterium]|nr:diguanylate cyclase [Sphingomonadaceae bacterium]